MQRLWLSGYRDYELGIFDPKAPEVVVIKRALRERLVAWLNQVDEEAWLLSGPQPGIERWGLEVGQELKADYPTLKLGMVAPFAQVEANWKPERQAALAQFKPQVDYFGTVSDQPYQNPSQLRAYQDFMFAHADRVLLVFDPERDSLGERHAKSYYDYRRAQQIPDLPLSLVTFDDLQEVAEEVAEEERDRQAGW